MILPNGVHGQDTESIGALSAGGHETVPSLLFFEDGERRPSCRSPAAVLGTDTFENRHYQIYGAPTAARGGAHKQRRGVPYCGFQAVAAQRPGRTPLAAQAAAKAARRAP